MPTVCGMCPVGCNVDATMREGKVKRILSRNHPEIDEGWLCDKGRFAFTHLRAGDRIVDPIKRVRRAASSRSRGTTRIDEAERLLARGDGPRRRRAVRLGDGRAGVRAREARCASASARTTAMLPEEISRARSTRIAQPLSAIARRATCRRARRRPAAESAPIVDLWMHAGRRKGARVVIASSTRRPCRAPSAPSSSGRAPAAEAARRVAAHAERLGFAARTAAALLPARDAERTRRRPMPGPRACDDEPAEPESVGLLLVSGDEAAATRTCARSPSRRSR